MVVDARNARFANMCGTATTACVSKRISEQLSRENCSEMRSDLDSVAPLRAFRNSHTPCVNYHAVADAWSADCDTRGADR
eukprot:2542900-Lingulodinium_polyedra.AAC.1